MCQHELHDTTRTEKTCLLERHDLIELVRLTIKCLKCYVTKLFIWRYKNLLFYATYLINSSVRMKPSNLSKVFPLASFCAVPCAGCLVLTHFTNASTARHARSNYMRTSSSNCSFRNSRTPQNIDHPSRSSENATNCIRQRNDAGQS